MRNAQTQLCPVKPKLEVKNVCIVCMSTVHEGMTLFFFALEKPHDSHRQICSLCFGCVKWVAIAKLFGEHVQFLHYILSFTCFR